MQWISLEQFENIWYQKISNDLTGIRIWDTWITQQALYHLSHLIPEFLCNSHKLFELLLKKIDLNINYKLFTYFNNNITWFCNISITSQGSCHHLDTIVSRFGHGELKCPICLIEILLLNTMLNSLSHAIHIINLLNSHSVREYETIGILWCLPRNEQSVITAFVNWNSSNIISTAFLQKKISYFFKTIGCISKSTLPILPVLCSTNSVVLQFEGFFSLAG